MFVFCLELDWKQISSQKLRVNLKQFKNTWTRIDQTSTKLQANVNHKSIKTEAKVYQRSPKHHLTFDENRGLEVVWADSGSQASLGKGLGWPLGDLGAKMTPSWASR